MRPLSGLTVSRDDIIQALRELIEMGYADAWDLTRRGSYATGEYEGMPPREEITSNDPRFFRTEEGLAFQRIGSSDWPFDENHTLREGWLASSRREELVRLFVLDSFRNCTHLRLVHLGWYSKALAGRYGITISREEDYSGD